MDTDVNGSPQPFGVVQDFQVNSSDSTHPPAITFSCIEDDTAGDASVPFNAGGTNIDLDPGFVTTINGPYRLGTGSPCIDMGTNTPPPSGIYPADEFDVDEDLDDDEETPEIDLMDRIVYGGTFDLSTFECIVDMGVSERLIECDTENFGDLNGDDLKDGLDIQPFVDCLLADPEDETCNCRRGDFRDADGVNVADVPLFVACVLSAGADCDVEHCPAFPGGPITTPPDCNENGVPDDVDITYCGSDASLCDCNGNGIPDGCDIANEISDDANENSIPDECEPDCNENDVPDDLDIANATSNDCDENGVPDECDQDCDGDNIPDACETLIDCNENGIFDACEPDCDNDGVPDACELSGNDCNGNNFPDDCEVNFDPPWNLPDCNNNDVPDECELSGNDCNENGILDECDIANEVSDDENENGIPDECESEGMMGGGGSAGMMMSGGSSFSTTELTESEAWRAYLDWCAATDFSSMNNAEVFSALLVKRQELGLPAGRMLPE